MSTSAIAPMSSVTPTIFAPVPDVVVILRVGISVYAPPPSDMCIFCIEPFSAVSPKFSKVPNSKTIWSVDVVCASDCSKSSPSSVIIL